MCSLLPPSPVCGCSPAAGGSTGSQMAGEWSTGWCCRRCSPSPPSPCRAAGPPCQPRPRDPLSAHSVWPGWPPSPSQRDPSHSNFSRTRVRPHPPRCRPQTERSLWSDSSAAYEPERWYLDGQDDSVLKISVDSQCNCFIFRILLFQETETSQSGYDTAPRITMTWWLRAFINIYCKWVTPHPRNVKT